jgi:hypothetical protein
MTALHTPQPEPPVGGVTGSRLADTGSAAGTGAACHWAKCSTSPAPRCATPTFPPPPSFRCTTSPRPAHRPRRPGLAMRAWWASRCSWAVIPRSSSAVVQTAGHAYRLDRHTVAERVQPRRQLPAFAAALYPGPDDPDGAVRRVQPPPLGGATAVPLVAADHGPRAAERELVMTQELVASMLGVRRESVTEAAGQFAERRLHPLPAWTHCGAGPRRFGNPGLRMLWGGQEGAGAAVE